MTLPEIIAASNIAPATIAERISMKRGTFHNKLKGHNNATFTYDEAQRIRVFLENNSKKTLENLKQ